MTKKLLALVLALMLLACVPAFAEGEASAERTVAPYSYELTEENAPYLENLIFNEDVIISGDNAQIFFVNCEFNGDVILTAETATRVVLLGCEFNGQCVFENGVQDADLIEYSFPKIVTDTPVDVVCEDGIGTFVIAGDFEVTFNGETYSMADSDFFSGPVNEDGTPSLIPYEGQPADYFIVVRVMTAGEPSVTLLCEAEIAAE